VIESGDVYDDRKFEELNCDATAFEAVTFRSCVFKHCSFVETVWKRCRFVSSLVRECDLSLVRTPDSVFASIQFEDSKLLGINWTEASWTSITMGKPVAFSRCNISHSTLLGLELRQLEIRDCVAKNVDFREADLRGADLRGTDFSKSLFQGANLSEADLRGARNYTIDAGQTTIAKARFSMPEALSLLYNLDIDLIDT
jgi:uncharacterized protein YjbI with pentapeptide repeats